MEPHRTTWFTVAAVLLTGGCSNQPSATSAEPPQAAIPAQPAASSQDGARTAETAPGNRLASETSPYLLLHAHNPVDWYPWGPEALEKAKRENKVIFLSVGYSSCHWCHVMERESFMDPEIAKLLNEHFVCIKVDREERPDVDAIYMAALQIYNRLSGSEARGGWPMSMFLTPETKPFFGGTYFPARDGDRGASTGFLTLAKRIQEFWSRRSEDLKRDANTLTRLVANELDGRWTAADAALDRSVLTKALDSLQRRYDPEYGGFGYSDANPQYPKFPEPSNLLFFIELQGAAGVSAEEKATALRMLVGTLERMAMGGIRDHLGGGFHRYSVDRYWRIPHFEKMLYDNGQLASVYAEAYRLTGRHDFRRVVEELLEFVEREMTAPGGGFYSALDAESEDEEGKYYRWQKEAIAKLLESNEHALFEEVYGLDDEPNFEGQFYALQLDQPLWKTAASKGIDEAELDQRLSGLRQRLLQARSRRARPLTDTKILTSWNGLMIRGFADAGRILGNRRYLHAAGRAADFVLDELRDRDGRFFRTYGQGQAKLNAYLDDYAFFVDGLIALYRATEEKRWLTAADHATAKQIELFWDEAHGGFFFTSEDHETLLARGRDPVDGAEPSGNSVAAENLIFLAKELGREEYFDKAERALRSASGLLDASPAAAPRLAMALQHWLAVRPEPLSKSPAATSGRDGEVDVD